MQRIRRDDTVHVIRGRERGKQGQVHEVDEEPAKDAVNTEEASDDDADEEPTTGSGDDEAPETEEEEQA